LVNKLNRCEDCKKPCKSCAGATDQCTECLDGFFMTKGTCKAIYGWPFPYLISAGVLTILTAMSECATVGRSHFKITLVALLSVPEFLSWIHLTVKLNGLLGLTTPTILSLTASIIYFVINIVHSILHPRNMIREAPFSYKNLVIRYACSTWFFRLVSYVLTYKFSLILLSHLFDQNCCKGDYSSKNWGTFNRLTLVWLLLAYPLQLVGCILFLNQHPLLSPVGFLVLEVLLISTALAVIGLVDVVKNKN